MIRMTTSCGLLLIAAKVICLSGCSRTTLSEDTGVTAPTVTKPVAVRTVAVTQEEVRKTTNQPATIHAFHETAIHPRVSGYLSMVNADIGDVVKVGSTLAVVAVPEMVEQREIFVAEIDRKKAEEDRARAGIELTQAGVTAAKARLEQARSELKSVDASLAAAEAEFRRTSDLVERRSLEPRILDEVRKKRDSEVARKAALTSAVGSADAEVKVAESGEAAAVADLKAAAAETNVAEQRLKELDVRLKFATITAPYDGVVTKRTAEPGALVSESETNPPLFVISQVDKVRVRISVPERDAAFVNPGDSVSLSFPLFSEEGLTASISRTSGHLDSETRMMLVEALIENKDGKLIPGMFGQAQISLASSPSSVLPARAVRFTETGDAYVYAVTDGEVSVISITTGTDDGSTIEIVSGVKPGQKVIDAHLQRFTDGQLVNLLN